MNPDTLKFAETHEWVAMNGNIATIGISQFAVDQLSDLVAMELPKVGSKLAVGKRFGEIESVKNVSDLYSPLDGEVLEINSAAIADPQILASGPYEIGWLIKVQVDDPTCVDGLLNHDAYQAQVASH